jgi:NMD protein affecting ribosome stability and mRNA decay
MTPPNTKVCCPNCKRPLGDVFESIVRQRGRFKGQREKARAEVLRLTQALEDIRQDLGDPHSDSPLDVAKAAVIARDALAGR